MTGFLTCCHPVVHAVLLLPHTHKLLLLFVVGVEPVGAFSGRQVNSIILSLSVCTADVTSKFL